MLQCATAASQNREMAGFRKLIAFIEDLLVEPTALQLLFGGGGRFVRDGVVTFYCLKRS